MLPEIADPVVTLVEGLGQKLLAVGTALAEPGQPAILVLDNVLSNGDIEKELKFVMAAAWRNSSDEHYRTCASDKSFFGADLDLIAFEMEQIDEAQSTPVFWMEVKCVFAEAIGNTDNAVRMALNQVGKYCNKLDHPQDVSPTHMNLYRKRVLGPENYLGNVEIADEIRAFQQLVAAVPPYIVHFVTRAPSEAVFEHMPPYIKMKLNIPEREFTAEDVYDRYVARLTPAVGEVHFFDFTPTEQNHLALNRELHGLPSGLLNAGVWIRCVATEEQLGAEIFAVIAKLR